MSIQTSAPAIHLNFFSDQTIADPVSVYHQMLAHGPVVWLAEHEMHAICGFEALTSSIRNHRVFRSGAGVSINDDVNKILVGSTLNSDQPQHDATRAITFKPLTPKALLDVRERIEAEANNIADRMVELGGFDAAADLAPHLPLTIVRDLVGLGGHGKDNMLTWGAATFELMGDPGARRDKAVSDLEEMRAYLDNPKTMEALDPDGWAQRATGRGIEAGIEPAKAVELMRDYIAPSLDTTISAIGYGVRLFAENPDQWAKVLDDRSLIKNAIEEIVRLNTPIRAFTRKLSEDIEVAGVPFIKNERVLMVFGAANRDPARFPDPDRFDVTRDVRGHVGFGHGVHACLGMHLARLEMTCLFNVLADRVERFEPNGPTENAINATIHAYSRAPVSIAAKVAA
jgi:cytochrome P450